MSKLSWLLCIALAGCASTPPRDADVLETTHYTLSVVAHCAEGEVACNRLTATLVDKRSGDRRELTGGTHMVPCADGTTPCHVGFYDLKGNSVSVRAYPDGALDVQSPGVDHRTERGTWR